MKKRASSRYFNIGIKNRLAVLSTEGSCIYVVYLVFEKRSILAAKMAHPKG
jgi:hypothetical protein